MKRLMTMLLVILVAGTTLHAEPGKKQKNQKKNIPPHRREMMEKRAELQMDSEEQEFHRENAFANLELQKQQMEVQHQRKMREMQRQMESLKVQQKKQALLKGSKKGPAKCDKGCGEKGDWKRKHRAGMWKACKAMKGLMLIVNILLAVWVYQDIRKRNAGSGIWIVLTLLIGFFGAALYLLARIGDNKAPNQS